MVLYMCRRPTSVLPGLRLVSSTLGPAVALLHVRRLCLRVGSGAPWWRCMDQHIDVAIVECIWQHE